ncbi:MAG: hypothetical protein EAX96_08910 [Candidatus Lokiarchaeota archaeon]|nr:hypothetical protein [Candidatus Lokiarchaeota archaeon]
MSQDVSKDTRILLVEYVLKKLKELTIQKRYKLPASKEITIEAINKLNSAIKQIKFSYILPLELVNNYIVKEFDLMTRQFWEAISKNLSDIEKNKVILLELRFIFNILQGFRERLMLGNESSIEKAIDVIAVKILSISNLNKKENLKICRVADGKQIINIITNLSNVKKDMVLPAAILPPREFGSEISEAMFCSNKDLVEMHEKIGKRVILSEIELKEVNNHVLSLLKDI